MLVYTSAKPNYCIEKLPRRKVPSLYFGHVYECMSAATMRAVNFSMLQFTANISTVSTQKRSHTLGIFVSFLSQNDGLNKLGKIHGNMHGPPEHMKTTAKDHVSKVHVRGFNHTHASVLGILPRVAKAHRVLMICCVGSPWPYRGCQASSRDIHS